MSSYSDLKTIILSLPNEYSRTLQLLVVVDGWVGWISYIKNKKLLYTFSSLLCSKWNYVALFSLNMCVISCKNCDGNIFGAPPLSLPYTLVLVSHSRYVRYCSFLDLMVVWQFINELFVFKIIFVIFFLSVSFLELEVSQTAQLFYFTQFRTWTCS